MPLYLNICISNEYTCQSDTHIGVVAVSVSDKQNGKTFNQQSTTGGFHNMDVWKHDAWYTKGTIQWNNGAPKMIFAVFHNSKYSVTFNTLKSEGVGMHQWWVTIGNGMGHVGARPLPEHMLCFCNFGPKNNTRCNNFAITIPIQSLWHSFDHYVKILEVPEKVSITGIHSVLHSHAALLWGWQNENNIYYVQRSQYVCIELCVCLNAYTGQVVYFV